MLSVYTVVAVMQIEKVPRTRNKKMYVCGVLNSSNFVNIFSHFNVSRFIKIVLTPVGLDSDADALKRKEIPFQNCGQSYKQFTLVNYNSRVVI